MNRQSHRRAVKKIIIALIALVAVGLIAFVSAGPYMRWTGQYHFGRVVQIDGNRLTLETNENALFQVNINEGTVVKQGWDTISGATLTNRSIIIIGPINGSGEIDAKIIRILKPTP